MNGTNAPALDHANPGEPPRHDPPGAPGPRPPTEAAFTFTGSGSEYFKIWIVNVLLTIVTLGIYSAWAKVRRIRYFYNNTRFAGSNFDFHGSPVAILKGRLVGVALLLLTYIPIVGPAFVLLFLAALPWLLTKAFQFHLFNTSWRNLRFRYVGTTADAYRALYLPILALIAIGGVGALLLGTAAAPRLGAALVFIALGLFYVLVPYLQYRMRRMYTINAQAGGSRFGFEVKPLEYYVPYILAVVAAMAVMFVLGLLAAALVPLVGASGLAEIFTTEPDGDAPPASFVLITLAVVALFYLAFAVVFPLAVALLHNLVWNGTQLEAHRFRARLPVMRYTFTWIGLTLLTLLTLGLYRPFAAVKLARMRVESVAWTGGPEDFVSLLAQENQQATGSEVADVMGFDFGL